MIDIGLLEFPRPGLEGLADALVLTHAVLQGLPLGLVLPDAGVVIRLSPLELLSSRVVLVDALIKLRDRAAVGAIQVGPLTFDSGRLVAQVCSGGPQFA